MAPTCPLLRMRRFDLLHRHRLEDNPESWHEHEEDADGDRARSRERRRSRG